ncbi:MAG: hypothetical protein ACKV2Q_01850 [Planctomycetaceae bacterium]
MDPQAAWDQLQEAFRVHDGEAVRELAQSLLDWLDRGGFSPVTSEGNRNDSARQRAIVIRFCNSVLQEMVDSLPPLCECFRPHP